MGVSSRVVEHNSKLVHAVGKVGRHTRRRSGERYRKRKYEDRRIEVQNEKIRGGGEGKGTERENTRRRSEERYRRREKREG